MTDYPEHEKLKLIKNKSQVVGAFLEWLEEQQMGVAEYDCYGDVVWHTGTKEEILAEFFDIDLDKLEDEKRAMLVEMRSFTVPKPKPKD